MSRFIDVAGRVRSQERDRRAAARRRSLSFLDDGAGPVPPAKHRPLLESLERRLLLANPPTLSLGASPLAAYTEGQDDAVDSRIASSGSITDDDSSDFQGGSLVVVASKKLAGEPAGDVGGLAIQSGSNITVIDSTIKLGGVEIGSVTGQDTTSLTISFSSALVTPAVATTLLQLVKYSNLRDDPVSAVTITTKVSDGDGSGPPGDPGDFSLPATQDVTITQVNDAPRRVQGVAPTDLLLRQSDASTATPIVSSNLDYDPVEAGQSLTYTVTAVPDPSLGQIVFGSGQDQTKVAAGSPYTLDQIRAMQFLSVAKAVGVGRFTFVVMDDGGRSNQGQDTLTESVAIYINAKPTVTSGSMSVGAGQTLSIDLRTLVKPDETAPADMTYTVTDPRIQPTATNGVFQYTAGSTASNFSFTFTVTDRGNPDGSPPSANATTSDAGSFSIVTAAIADVGLSYLDAAGNPLVPDPATGGYANPAVVAGEYLVYRILVSNNGPSDAALVSVNDALPADATFIKGYATDRAGNLLPGLGDLAAPNGLLTVDLGTVGPGDAQARVVTIIVQPTAQSLATITNRASLPLRDYDKNQANDRALIDTAVAKLGFQGPPLSVPEGNTHTEGDPPREMPDSNQVPLVVRLLGDVGRTLPLTVTNVANPQGRFQPISANIQVGPGAGTFPADPSQLRVSTIGNRMLDGNFTFTVKLSYLPPAISTPAGVLQPPAIEATQQVTIVDDDSLVVINNNAQGPGSLLDALRVVNASVVPMLNGVPIPFEVTFDASKFTSTTIQLTSADQALVVEHPISLNGRFADGRTITIDGGNLNIPGLRIAYYAATVPANPPGSILRNFVIRNFAGGGLELSGGGGHTVAGNRFEIGAKYGILVSDSAGNTLGGLGIGEGNTITIGGQTAPAPAAIAIKGSSAVGNAVIGNLIVNDRGVGIAVDSGTDNALLANTIPAGSKDFAGVTAAPGIQLLNQGNGGQVAPTLTGASAFRGNATIQGTLQAAAGSKYRIDFYTNNVNNPAVKRVEDLVPYPQAMTFLKSLDTEQADGNGNISFTLNLVNTQAILPNQYVTAVATLIKQTEPVTKFGGSSTISRPVLVTNGLIVTTKADLNPDGTTASGSLREAIVNANTTSSTANTIRFNIPANQADAGVYVLKLDKPLDAINSAVLIDGYSQDGAVAASENVGPIFRIILDGSGLTEAKAGPGLTILTPGSDKGLVTIQGLVFQHFAAAAIDVEGDRPTQILGNYFGTDATGTNSASGGSRTGTGIVLGRTVSTSNVTIGGSRSVDRNLISGLETGVDIGAKATSVSIVNNGIGTNAAGTARIANTTGVRIEAGASAVIVGGNLISGNAGYGIDAGATTGLVIVGNSIGTDAKITTGLANDLGGIRLNGVRGSTIGGRTVNSLAVVTEAERNVIAGNGGAGIEVVGGSDNQIINNLLGLDRGGLANVGLRNGGEGIVLTDATRTTIGSATDPARRNFVANSALSGIKVTGRATSLVTIAGNALGTDLGSKADTGDFANLGDGILIDAASDPSSASGVLIRGNLVAGSGRYGVEVTKTVGVNIVGNAVGLNFDGIATSNLRNALGGIRLANAPATTIGGDPGQPGLANTISNNATGIDVRDADAANPAGRRTPAAGIIILDRPSPPGETALASKRSTILGNFIGSDPTGGAARGNLGAGVYVQIAGITDPGDAIQVANNLISANRGTGLQIVGTDYTRITGNKIGTDRTGTQGLGDDTTTGRSGQGNNGIGILLDNSRNTTVGGAGSGEGNTISANRGSGLDVRGTGTVGLVVSGNQIGTDPNGRLRLGNLLDGIILAGTGVAPAPIITNNTISGNSGYGIAATSTPGLILTRNRVGVDGPGAGGLGNEAGGVMLTDSGGAIVGGGTDAEGNVLSGNVGANNSNANGLTIIANRAGQEGTTVSHNRIGTDSAGSSALGNSGDGLLVKGPAVVFVTANTVAANTRNGLHFDGASSPVVTGNRIGIDSGGTFARGNTGAGILIENMDAATIGSLDPADANVIAANDVGIRVKTSMHAIGITIRGNFLGTNRNLQAGLGNIKAGLDVSNAADVLVDGNTIAGNIGDGVFAQSATGLRITGNFVGTDSSRLKIRGNAGAGIRLKDTDGAVVGGAGLPGNVVANNGLNGIEVEGARAATIEDNVLIANVKAGIFLGGALDSVVLKRNLVGLAARDSADLGLGNLGDGIFVLKVSASLAAAQAATIEDNTISFNAGNGVQVAGSSRVSVLGNRIGVNAASRGVGNRLDGVLLTGGTSATRVDGNTIANSGNHGVEIRDAADNGDLQNVILGNTITRSLGNGVQLVGRGTSGNLIAGNTIADNSNSGVGITESASANTLRGNRIGLPGLPNFNDGVSILQAGPSNNLSANVIAGNNNNGILISGTNSTTLVGNFVGTDASGAAGLGNRNIGLAIDVSVGTSVLGNTISGNQSQGVAITGGSSFTALKGNFIGTDPTGGRSLGNKLNGVILVSSSNNTLGGPGADGNVIAANESNGILIFQGSGNTIAGNFVGTDRSAKADLGNKGDGIFIVNSSRNTIGVPDGGGNVVSANLLSGIEILGNAPGLPADSGVPTEATERSAEKNVIQFNVLGTEMTDRAEVLGNKQDGVRISGTKGTAKANEVRSNTIAANQKNGIAVTNASETLVAGNKVGLDKLENANDGINLDDTESTAIDAGNLVAFNARNGATVAASGGTTIRGSTFARNGRDGIDLFGSAGTVIGGTVVRENGVDGIRIEQGSIGDQIGEVGAPPNEIDFNGVAGIEIATGSTGVRVRNSRIGLADGLLRAQNQFGILIAGVSGNDIGDPAAPNVISGNVEAGVRLIGGATSNNIHHNTIGLSAAGDSAVLHAGKAQRNGVYIQDSQSNKVFSNAISGNVEAGVQIIGQFASANHVSGNTIGADVTATKPVTIGQPGDPATATNVYSTANRQIRGVWINNSSGNLIGPDPAVSASFNRIYANQNGVVLDGVLAARNLIFENLIGPDPAQVREALTEQLGNFNGIDVSGAPSNTIRGNLIRSNISAGIIFEKGARGNVVQGNNISANGGFGEPNLVGSDGIRLANRIPKMRIFGVGVYIDGTRGNVIGTSPNLLNKRPSASAGQGNTIDRNILVGVYMVNGASGNTVAGNRITGGGQGFGEYGVFLYNSAGNLESVIRSGPRANVIRGHFIAQFREYTGPGPRKPQVVKDLDIPNGGRRVPAASKSRAVPKVGTAAEGKLHARAVPGGPRHGSLRVHATAS